MGINCYPTFFEQMIKHLQMKWSSKDPLVGRLTSIKCESVIPLDCHCMYVHWIVWYTNIVTHI